MDNNINKIFGDYVEIRANRNPIPNKNKEVKKPKFKKVSFLQKMKSNILKLWNKYITIPLETRREKRLEIANVKALKKNFKKQFGVDPEHIKRAIDCQRNFSGAKIEQTKVDYLNDKLVEGRKSINETRDLLNRHGHSKSPLFYEPEICDIHNENPFRVDYPAMYEITKRDSDVAKETLENSNSSKLRKLARKAKLLWITRS